MTGHENLERRRSAVVPIVLTATIVPNAITTHECNWETRRNQYLHAIAFYQRFSKVYFVENSSYDLASDSAFVNNENCCIVKLPMSERPERGKGYQEFQMLDEFVSHSLAEEYFLKITGRYVYANFGRLFSFLLGKGEKYDLVIDRLARGKLALTSLFATSRQFYLRYFQGAYQGMDDREGVWAERVSYDLLEQVEGVQFFPMTPVLQAQGQPTLPDVLKVAAKNLQRRLLSVVHAGRLLR